ncbi:copper homeostasis protein CutC [Vallitalea guaymasensis]|uniref:PF03932 family protein CutC n=1 Tax=Vallitalea guaymasensis TaxID=1185412 RepID=A0A8J8M7R9_9FIRM|nr:copper homeostasis protein CutC [Vallitalea guaymasensis]QUH27690.1 copper homeostasis protein CutC [Vallitalea guaymasensis]
MYILEGCVDSVESAIEAEKGGGNRLELCSNLIIGGTTPSINLFNMVREHTNIKINVLIRPRFGDFCYSDKEFEVIKREVKMFQEAGADGVVIGVLNPDGTLDIDRMNELIHITEGMHITLHRAFDMCKNPLETLEQAKQLGINTILTSGQKNSCYDGKELIRELVNNSKGKVDILIGGGVKAEIIKEMYKFTGAVSYHMSGKEVINSSMEYRKEEVSMGIASLSEYSIWQTSSTKISQVKDILEKLISN